MDSSGLGLINLIGNENPDAFFGYAQGNDSFINGTEWAKQQLQDHPDLFVRLMKDIRNKPDGEKKSKNLSTLENIFNQLPGSTQQKLISKLNQSDAHERYLNQVDQYFDQEAGIGAPPESEAPPTSGADFLALTSL